MKQLFLLIPWILISLSVTGQSKGENPYAIFGGNPYVAGCQNENKFIIEDISDKSVISKIEHNPTTGQVELRNSINHIIKEIQLQNNESGWHSMDPMAEKYYSISPYAYCANNPVKYIDPNGDTISVSINGVNYNYQSINGVYGFYDSNSNMYNGDNEFITSLTGALSTIVSKENGKGVVDDLITSDKTLFIIENNEGKNNFNSKNKTIEWDYLDNDGGYNEINSDKRPPFISLAHELGHAHRRYYNKGFNGKWTETLPRYEIYALHIENLVRAEHNISLRTHYDNKIESTRVVSGGNSKYFFTPGSVFPSPYNYRRR